MTDIRRIVASLAADTAKRSNDERLDNFIKISSESWDKGANYAGIIVGLGYAAYFAMWSNVSQYLPPGFLLLSALFVSLSMCCFVTLEVLRMFILAVSTNGVLDAIVRSKTLEEHDEAIQVYQKEQRIAGLVFMGIWKFLFPVTVFFGLSGAAILICGFAARLYVMYAYTQFAG